jgi:hypothetical protein
MSALTLAPARHRYGVAHDATFFPSRNGIIKDLCTTQHLLLLPLPKTFFVKVSSAIAAAHIICREPFKALVAV